MKNARKDPGLFECYHCLTKWSEKVPPRQCPECGSKYMLWLDKEEFNVGKPRDDRPSKD